MQVTMQHAERLTLAAMGEFLEASSNLSFGGAGRKQIYGLLEGALHAQTYLGLPKKHKGIVHLYLVKISGLSKAQITRSCRLTDPADWPCLRRAGPREPEPLIFAAGFSASLCTKRSRQLAALSAPIISPRTGEATAKLFRGG